MRPRPSLAAALAVGAFFLGSDALAQTRHDHYDYHFEEDNLVGDTLSTPPPLLRIPEKGRRVLMIRPRVTFVAELIGTVEAL